MEMMMKDAKVIDFGHCKVELFRFSNGEVMFDMVSTRNHMCQNLGTDQARELRDALTEMLGDGK